MPGRPILLFPAPVVAERAKRGGGGGGISVPAHERQVDRLRPQFQTLRRTFEAESADLRPGIAGAEPAKVLVLELAGSVDNFLAAVKRIPGLEWLAAVDTEDLLPDSDFHRQEDETLEKPSVG